VRVEERNEIMKKVSYILLVMIMLMALTPAFAMGDTIYIFKDVEKTPWASEAIQVLYQRGIINGYDENTFGVQDPITREQFAKVLSLSFTTELENVEVGTFVDLNPTDWSYKFVESVKEYLTGYYPPNGRPFFSPKTNTTREDVAVALVRAMKLPVDNIDGKAILSREIRDVDSISPRLVNEVAVAYQNGLLKGFPDGTFRGSDPINRASVATLLYRVMKSSYSSANTGIKLDLSIPEQVYSNTVRISGKVDQNADLYINDNKISFYGDTFEEAYSLDRGEGEYDFEFKVILNGLTKTEKRTVRLVYEAPIITLDDSVSETEKAQWTLSGKVVDKTDRAADVTINGIKIDLGRYDGTFSEIFTLKKGENKYVIQATNSLGKMSEMVKTITLNSAGPKVEIEHMPTTTADKDLIIKGTVKDINDDRPSLYINDKSTNVSYAGNFSRTYVLNEGTNTFSFMAKNKNGEVTTITRTIVFTAGAPEITFDNIPQNTSTKTVSIKGTVKDANDTKPTMYINDGFVSVSYSGRFNKSYSLADGENVFIFKSKNKDGKETIITKTIIYSPGAPEVTFANMPETTTKKKITITGSVKDSNDSRPSFHINDVSASIDYRSNFSKSYTLKEGENTFVFKAKNKDGKETIITKKIVLETSKPTIIANVPETANKESIKIEVGIEDENYSIREMNVSINGRTLSYSYPGFSYYMNLVEGVNTITIVAVNPAGKRTEVQKVIEYKILPPEINVDVPEIVNKENYTITGKIVESNGVRPSLTINGETVSVASSYYAFNKAVVLNEGVNTFVFKATSSVTGKSSELTKTIVWEILQPTLNTSIPTTSEVAELQLSGNVFDEVDDSVAVTVNGTSVNCSSSGSWNFKLDLVDGANNVVVVATNKYGKETRVERSVEYKDPNASVEAENTGTEETEGTEAGDAEAENIEADNTGTDNTESQDNGAQENQGA